MCPGQLFIRLRALQEIDRVDRENQFRSVSAAISAAFGAEIKDVAKMIE